MTTVKAFLFSLFLFFSSISLFNVASAQTEPVDTSTVQQVGEKEEKAKKPLRATLMSAVVPGSGQLYVGGWSIVKVPVMYAGFGALIYSISFNKEQYEDFRKAVKRELQGKTHQFSDLNISAAGLRSQRDFYRKNMELSYIGTGLLYIANVIDAFVSAHLTSFDVDDDLSLRLKPFGEMTQSRETVAGVTLQFRF